MQLIEVMVAAAVFSAATGSSLQLWSRAASSNQRLEQRHMLQERIELDRLQLQAHWRQAFSTAEACPVDGARLAAAAAGAPVPPQLERELIQIDGDGGIGVRWRAVGPSKLERQRLFTPAGLGLCGADATQFTTPLESGL